MRETPPPVPGGNGGRRLARHRIGDVWRLMLTVERKSSDRDIPTTANINYRRAWFPNRAI